MSERTRETPEQIVERLRQGGGVVELVAEADSWTYRYTLVGGSAGFSCSRSSFNHDANGPTFDDSDYKDRAFTEAEALSLLRAYW